MTYSLEGKVCLASLSRAVQPLAALQACQWVVSLLVQPLAAVCLPVAAMDSVFL